MRKKDLHLIYDKLIRLWQNESNLPILSELTEDDIRIFQDFQKIIHKTEDEELPNGISEFEKEIMIELKTSSCKIVDFFIEDMLNIRQQKIIEFCRELKKIDEKLLTASEKEFYRNMMSAFKGNQKSRNISNVLADACHVDEKDEGETFCETEEYNQSINDKEIEYVYIRILTSIPSIVGRDYLNYGPFKAEDIAVIPRINAIILEKENLIEIL